jgi:choline dehydrogenase-like flavoprotein
MKNEKYDVVVVGTGFASSFFLHSYLKRAKTGDRILVLERGYVDDHAWQIKNEKSSRIDHRSTFVNKSQVKNWLFSVGFGGSSNCWWGNTTRFLPSDFELHSRYGVGFDWPITYDELEPFYQEAEEIMSVSGPSDMSILHRSGSYPQPPHRFTEPDKVLKQAHPDSFFNMPTARARVATQNRPRCCSTGVCNLCPVDAKFTIQNEMQHIYADERITLELGSTVQSIEITSGIAKGISYLQEGNSKQVDCDLVVLGANAIFNPFILLRSGLEHPLLGKRLNEQIGLDVSVYLDGLDNYQGSTSFTGMAYMQADGPHRSERAAIIAITNNSVQFVGHALRMERGKWRRRLNLSVFFEDLPSERNYVTVSKADPTTPETVFEGYSEYAQRSVDALPAILPKMLESLPVEYTTIDKPVDTTGHIQGTTVMGDDPTTSVIDRYLVHHRVRNLVVLGSGAFPSCPPAMPTLTLSALSLWASKHL